MAKTKQCISCEKEIAKNAKTCPYCGARLRYPRWPFLLGALVLFFMFSGDDDSGSSYSKKKTYDESDYSAGAYTACKLLVKGKLKAPATAQFPNSILDYKAYWKPDTGYDKTVIVKSYVDAQNSFGAKIRSNWICEVTYNTGSPYLASNWTAGPVVISR